MSILVVGSVAIDTVTTPFGMSRDIIGGSATYFSMAASMFDRVNIIAVVGRDFPKRYISLFKNKKIGLEGLHIADGKTFRWIGRYGLDLKTAHTIATRLNVFKDFKPSIPEALKNSDFLFLANIDPDLQYDVLKQMRKPKLIACDSMNYWLVNKRKSFERLLGRIDILLLNDAEARQFTGKLNLICAARKIISMGPKAVVIKKGEHGVVCFSKNSHFITPAYLLETVYDPTGAGDTFAGGMVGYLSTLTNKIDDAALRKSVVYGSILASFAVEDFSINRLLRLSRREVEARLKQFCRATNF